MPRVVSWLAIGLCGLALLVGCRKEEQGRFRMYEPGVYQGKPDQGLSEAQRDALVARMSIQAGGTLDTSRIDKMPDDVRPPQ